MISKSISVIAVAVLLVIMAREYHRQAYTAGYVAAFNEMADSGRLLPRRSVR